MDDKKKKEDELLDHNYDGIEEYDNDLPSWWKWLFYITMIFGVVYVVYYHFGPGLSQVEVLERDLAKLEKDRLAYQEKQARLVQASAPKLEELVKDASFQEKGREVYVAKCLSCHGPLGGGLIGPNLTDDYWVHGGTPQEIKHIIEVGVLEKGMLAWKDLMSDQEINSVVAYIVSIRGSNPPGAKAPEGDLIEN